MSTDQRAVQYSVIGKVSTGLLLDWLFVTYSDAP